MNRPITRIEGNMFTFQPTGNREEKTVPVLLDPPKTEWTDRTQIPACSEFQMSRGIYQEYVLSLTLSQVMQLPESELRKSGAEFLIEGARMLCERHMKTMLYGDVFNALKAIEIKVQDMARAPGYERQCLRGDIQDIISDLRSKLREFE